MTTPECKTYLMCGSGGVGKTTLSAALALKMAMNGHKTIVLTIDPAKRLANSMGIADLGNTPQRISLPKSARGELHAMMLDTKRTFDHIVEKYAPSSHTRDKIFGNRVYQQLSQMLAGSHEYMAMEKLHEIWLENRFDRIVIDTPPMQNAVDFLEAPKRMDNMISNSMLHLLLKPSLSLGKKGLKLFERGTQQILKVFDRIIGFAFMQDISEMLIAFQDLIGGFQSRAREVKQLLANPNTNFIIVCTPHQNSVSEAKMFRDHLVEDGFRLHTIIVNRVHTGPLLSSTQMETDQKALSGALSKQEAACLVDNYRHYLPLIKQDQARLKQMLALAEKKTIDAIPLFESDIHDLESLARLGEYLNLESD